MIEPTIAAGLVGAGAVLAPSLAAALIAWGNIHATIDALKARMSAVEREMSKIDEVLEKVSYIQGVLDGEARSARKALTR